MAKLTKICENLQKIAKKSHKTKVKIAQLQNFAHCGHTVAGLLFGGRGDIYLRFFIYTFLSDSSHKNTHSDSRKKVTRVTKT